MRRTIAKNCFGNRSSEMPVVIVSDTERQVLKDAELLTNSETRYKDEVVIRESTLLLAQGFARFMSDPQINLTRCRIQAVRAIRETIEDCSLPEAKFSIDLAFNQLSIWID